jgi:hypothetical protein
MTGNKIINKKLFCMEGLFFLKKLLSLQKRMSFDFMSIIIATKNEKRSTFVTMFCQ